MAAQDAAAQPATHTQDQYGVREQAEEFPMMVVIAFSYRCNAACPHCPYTNSDIRSDYRDTPFMSEATFKTIADQCGPYGAFIRVSGGGEPMLHPQAVDLFCYAKSVGAKVGLITNGSMLDEPSSRRLLEAGLDMIEVSVDAADAATYGRVRRGLDWDRLLANVERLARLRAELRSPSKIVASGVNQQGVDVDAVERFWLRHVDYFIKRKYLTWNINDPDASADPTPYLPPDQRIPCPFIFERLNVDSRGKVLVCGFDIVGVTDLGNVNDTPIRDIWHGREFRHYRDKHLTRRGADIPLCRDCPDWKYRSWQHNYWKVVRSAEQTRAERLAELKVEDEEGAVVG